MQNVDSWQPTKFVQRGKKWVCSSDPNELGRGTRIYGAITIECCQRAITNHARGRLLDLGCGKVPLYGVYRPFITEAVCIDWPSSLHGSKHVDRFVDLNDTLPFDDKTFDTILSTEVIEHIAQPDHLWREMTRILRPGGKIIQTCPFLYPVHEAPHDYHRYTEFKLRQFAEQNGLSVVELEACGGALEVILDIMAKHLYRHRMISNIHLALSLALLKLKPLKAISEDTKRAFPAAYCLIAQKSV